MCWKKPAIISSNKAKISLNFKVEDKRKKEEKNKVIVQWGKSEKTHSTLQHYEGPSPVSAFN